MNVYTVLLKRARKGFHQEMNNILLKNRDTKKNKVYFALQNIDIRQIFVDTTVFKLIVKSSYTYLMQLMQLSLCIQTRFSNEVLSGKFCASIIGLRECF